MCLIYRKAEVIMLNVIMPSVVGPLPQQYDEMTLSIMGLIVTLSITRIIITITTPETLRCLMVVTNIAVF